MSAGCKTFRVKAPLDALSVTRSPGDTGGGEVKGKKKQFHCLFYTVFVLGTSFTVFHGYRSTSSFLCHPTERSGFDLKHSGRTV